MCNGKRLEESAQSSTCTITIQYTMAEEEDTRDVADFYADIPVDFKGLRCCLRCSLLKSYEQVSKQTIVLFLSALSSGHDLR